MKIAIIGYTGSGKSTLAGILADFYKIPLLFLDTVHYMSGWVERETEEGRSIVEKFLENESWVIDGNYDRFLKEERLEKADVIIYMNFPRLVCLYRAYKRYLKYKNSTRESMTEGCIEYFNLGFAWWILHGCRTKERQDDYKRIQSIYKDKMIVLKNKRQVDDFINETIKLVYCK